MTTVASTYTAKQLVEFREERIKFVLKGCIAVIKAYEVFKDEHDIVRNLADHSSEFTNDLCFDNVMEIQPFDDSDDNRMLFLQLEHFLINVSCDKTEAMEAHMKELTDHTAKLLVRFNYGN